MTDFDRTTEGQTLTFRAFANTDPGGGCMTGIQCQIPAGTDKQTARGLIVGRLTGEFVRYGLDECLGMLGLLE